VLLRRLAVLRRLLPGWRLLRRRRGLLRGQGRRDGRRLLRPAAGLLRPAAGLLREVTVRDLT
jgi:hypothetical protein